MDDTETEITPILDGIELNDSKYIAGMSVSSQLAIANNYKIISAYLLYNYYKVNKRFCGSCSSIASQLASYTR